MKRVIISRKLSCIVSKTIVLALMLGMSVTGCLETTKEIPITLTASASALHFPFNGEEQTITIDSNTNSWRLDCDASWVSFSPSSGSKKGTVTVRASSNSATENLSATITITGTGILTPRTIPVSIGAAPLLTITPPSLSFAASDTPKQLTVASNTSWNVSNSTAWLTVAPMSGANNGTLTVTATVNTSTEQRTATVSVSNPDLTQPRTVNVTQSGVNPVLQVSPTTLSFAATDSPKTFTVSSNINWSVSFSGASWLTVAPMSGNGDGTVTVIPAANTATAGRNVNLTVSGAGVSSQTVSVSQSGTAPSITIDMVLVSGGSFTMGCTSEQGSDCDSNERERPSHSVTLSTFYIGKYEVTEGQWKAVMGDNPSYYPKGDNYPVENVRWNDIVGTSGATTVINGITYYANGFIYKLNQMTGKQYRLPTEAEWEYAARGRRSNGNKYSGSNTVGDVAWYSSNSGSSKHPVGTKAANELGIYDMSGNVYEWCSDWFSSSYYNSSPQNNPLGPSTGSLRVGRGGSWYSSASSVRVSFRNYWVPGDRYDLLGFRLASSSN